MNGSSKLFQFDNNVTMMIQDFSFPVIGAGRTLHKDDLIYTSVL